MSPPLVTHERFHQSTVRNLTQCVSASDHREMGTYILSHQGHMRTSSTGTDKPDALNVPPGVWHLRASFISCCGLLCPYCREYNATGRRILYFQGIWGNPKQTHSRFGMWPWVLLHLVQHTIHHMLSHFDRRPITQGVAGEVRDRRGGGELPNVPMWEKFEEKPEAPPRVQSSMASPECVHLFSRWRKHA